VPKNQQSSACTRIPSKNFFQYTTQQPEKKFDFTMLYLFFTSVCARVLQGGDILLTTNDEKDDFK
jgi:hypothetical protein